MRSINMERDTCLLLIWTMWKKKGLNRERLFIPLRMRAKPFQVPSQRYSSMLSFGSKSKRRNKRGREEKEKTRPFLYSKTHFLLSPLGGKTMNDFNKYSWRSVRWEEGRVFQISMLYMHRACVENSLVTSFQVTGFRISAHLTCSRGQRSLWNRQGCICLQSLFLQEPACPFVDGMNKSFCATHQGCKVPWLHWVERWIT